jgi:hypothetical protein
MRSLDKCPPRMMTGWNSLGPAMNRSFRNWAQPYCAAGMICHSSRKPGSSTRGNDIIGLAPMPEARNEIVKRLLRHRTQGFKQ